MRSGVKIDTHIANTKDQYNLCTFVRGNRDFCIQERFQNHLFSELSAEKIKTRVDHCNALLDRLAEADILLLYR